MGWYGTEHSACPIVIHAYPTHCLMTKFLPFFPLSLVVYPQEKLNLHVFEPRYRQLIDECISDETTFGMPAFFNNKIADYGTEMQITALNKRYDDGRMDIETVGLGIFKLLSFENPVEDRLYAGGDTEEVELIDDASEQVLTDLLQHIKQLYELLQMKLEIDLRIAQFVSFEIAHRIGLSVEQEYELLTMPSEADRQVYLLEHLRRTIPVVYDMERTKARVRLNGHFKHFDPLNF